MQEIVFRDKQLKILLLLRDKSKDWYISTLAKSSGTTYVHTCNFILECEGRGLTTSERHGKIKVVKLTDKGAQLSEMLNGANELMNIQQQQHTQAGNGTPQAQA
jgi:predicted transcriptional regulator